MQPMEGMPEDRGHPSGGSPKAASGGALSPLVSAALEGHGSLVTRLSKIAEHSSAGERYTVLGEIGSGGMGRVLRVWDEDLQRELAMKEIAKEGQPSESDQERAERERLLGQFIDEARITGQLDHPGIVPVHEIAIDREGNVYFTMPLVRGDDLQKVIRYVHHGEQEWNLTRAVNVMLKVCLAVAFAHSKGVIHRDLKPANIMVGPFGEAYVMDWGLALVLGRKGSGRIVGTPAYMSPEQAGGKDADVGPRADVYSLGAILYELLTNKMPHELSLDGEQGMQQVLDRAPTPILDIRHDVPRELVAISEMAMAREIDERYPSVLEMADDLRAWLEGRVVRAHETGTVQRVKKWMARNRGLSIALEAIAVLLVVSVIFFFVQQQQTIEAIAAEREDAVLNSYTSNLRAADLSLRMLETGTAKDMLRETDHELRGWEWRHLNLRSDTSLRMLAGHGDTVQGVAFSPDGALLVTASDDGSLLLWNTRSGEVERTLDGHDKEVKAVAFSPDGEQLASGSQDKTVRIWETATGKQLRILPGHELPVSSVAFAPNGEALASGDHGGAVHLWNLSTGLPIASMLREAVGDTHVAFLEAEDRLAAAYGDGKVCLWKPSSEELVAVHAHGERIDGLAARGSTLAVATGGSIHLLETEVTPETNGITPKEVLETDEQHVTCVGFTPTDGKVVFGTTDKRIWTWDPTTGTLLHFAGHDQAVTSVASHPDGVLLVSGSQDGTARLWHPDAGAEAVLRGHGGWVNSLAFSPDGRRVLSGSHDCSLILWDTVTGEKVKRIQAPDIVDCVAFHPDGKRVAYGSNDRLIRIWDLETNALDTTLRGHEMHIISLVFSPDGTRLLSRSQDETVRVWNVSTGEVIVTLPNHDLVASVAFHPTGTSFATGADDGRIRLWNTETGELRRTLKVVESSITALAYAPDGAVLAAGTIGHEVVLCRLNDDSVENELVGHDKPISSVVFSPDGRRLVTGSHDNTVRVWDRERGDLLLTLRGHGDKVSAVVFSPNGDEVASASQDQHVRLWRTRASLQPILNR